MKGHSSKAFVHLVCCVHSLPSIIHKLSVTLSVTLEGALTLSLVNGFETVHILLLSSKMNSLDGFRTNLLTLGEADNAASNALANVSIGALVKDHGAAQDGVGA